MFFHHRLLFLSLVSAICLAIFASGAPLLEVSEVEALKEIGQKLGKNDWNFEVDPCSREVSWVAEIQTNGFEKNVSCDCSFSNATVCHVVSIIDQAPFSPTNSLHSDLSRNYLSGTIPPEWSSLPLVNISLLGNQLTGPIPKDLANITTLKSLVLEFNQLSGVLPPELGNLSSLERLYLTSNNFTGELPKTFEKLTTLKEFLIGGNNFTGKIPDFIQNWTNLTRLFIQGSGLDGPIPSGIGALKKLTDLRISDLNGNDSNFPLLENLINLETLILRSCNLIGEIPLYLGNITQLKTLDLSFNKLSGVIPSNFTGLEIATYVYLTGNLLTGQVPGWLVNSRKKVDLSYNNFTAGLSEVSNCQSGAVNLFATSSKANDTTGIVSCLKSSDCPQNKFMRSPSKACQSQKEEESFHYFKEIYFLVQSFLNCYFFFQALNYHLHINCGGKEVTVDGNTRYDADTDAAGPSKFFISRNYWGFSSTGHYLDGGSSSETYIWQNSAILSINDSQAPLYMQARLSPLSLTYYGFCLGNGNYTVKLHFAEIMFNDDKTYSSLGRRIFNVYIQGKLVLKDFNIEVAADGVGKAITIPIVNVSVTSNTVEIRFIWAGKGTTALPNKGVYGPLISAISVDAEFTPPSEGSGTPPSEKSSSITAGAVIGIVAGAVVTIILILGILWWKGCLRWESTLEQVVEDNQYIFFLSNLVSSTDLKGMDLHTGSFTLRQIKAATNNFAVAHKIGEGGFGPVYKVHDLKEKENLMDLVDPRLGSDFNKKEVMVMINVALLCTDTSSAVRPTMSSVVSMLEGRAAVPDSIPNSSDSVGEAKLEAMRNYYQYSREQSNEAGKSQSQSQIQSQSMSIDGLWTGSSTSASDLYPVNLVSEYLITRN
ncbi:hypothetical protein Patl1_04924 [Pistacia atlantica]|uniref:Uncharacterized protein n=1 Tax=Pistacia atlantica TaxID=434234 RepID=A0ACC1BWZ6_9ROSI|nr:hypothetical protein Patl1_04924 [Pistacia atlantica]